MTSHCMHVCRLLTSDSAAAAGSDGGRTCSKALRQLYSSATHPSATHSVHGGVQTATATTRGNASGACFPSWLPSALQPVRNVGSIASSTVFRRQTHQAAWVSRGIVQRQHILASESRPLMLLLLRQQQYTTASQLASSATSWRLAARRIAFQRLQVSVLVVADARRLGVRPGKACAACSHCGSLMRTNLVPHRIGLVNSYSRPTRCAGDTGATAADHVCGPRGPTHRQRGVLQGQPRAAAAATVCCRDGTPRQVCRLPCRAQHL